MEVCNSTLTAVATDSGGGDVMVMVTVMMLVLLSATRATIAMEMMRCDRPLSTMVFPRELIASIRSIIHSIAVTGDG